MQAATQAPMAPAYQHASIIGQGTYCYSYTQHRACHLRAIVAHRALHASLLSPSALPLHPYRPCIPTPLPPTAQARRRPDGTLTTCSPTMWSATVCSCGQQLCGWATGGAGGAPFTQQGPHGSMSGLGPEPSKPPAGQCHGRSTCTPPTAWQLAQLESTPPGPPVLLVLVAAGQAARHDAPRA